MAKTIKIKVKDSDAKKSLTKDVAPQKTGQKSRRLQRVKKPPKKRKSLLRRIRNRILFRYSLRGLILVMAVILLFSAINPPSTLYIKSEERRLGSVDHEWVPIEEISPHVMRAVVAAEDVNFCAHFGFDIAAIRQAVIEGGNRGASTITQQTVKNTFLWTSRSWIRKALEAVLTPAVEALWTKRRVLEVYLNVIEFDEGVFGIDAASHHYFRKSPQNLTLKEASLLAAVLPNPKGRSASRPTSYISRRAVSIADGARVIRNTDKVSCFED